MNHFVHLHCHSEYSILDGAIRLGDLCSRAQQFGMPACAVTDHGNMFAAAAFQKACSEYGVKPIFGCEVYTCQDHLDRTDKKRNHLILLARNEVGYHNLLKIVTTGYLEGFYYKPRVDWNILSAHAEGITCLTACLQGEIPQAILAGDMDKAQTLVHQYSALYSNHFYLELQHNGISEQTTVNNKLLELAETEHLPVVATNDCHYLDAADFDTHELLLCMQTKTTIDEPNRLRFPTNEFYYKSPDQMAEEFNFVPEAIANTVRIAEECNFELTFERHFFPAYPLPSGATPESEFRRQAEAGLEQRLQENPGLDREAYLNRLQSEISVILRMGFASYFLIVSEFVNWAKSRGIPVGPGRGSAAGSLVSWALRITNLNPIPYNLLFERFLNPERVSLPDIDVDFCERRRDEVIQHMKDVYGEDCVAQIATFGTLTAKAVIHGVARALGMNFQERSAITKLIPDAPADAPVVHIADVLKDSRDLQLRYKKEPKVKTVIDYALKLEGTVSQVGTHASGIVVSDKPMVEYLPLLCNKDGSTMTQFDGAMVEQTGLVKFDFLGLKTMTLIQDTLDNIAKEGKELPNLDTLPFTDPAVYELYAKGDTDGVFQVEGPGMRQYLTKLKPTCFEDIIAMLALYRPGPLGPGMVDEFIRRQHGELPVVYPHPSLENCLRDTYGVIVYQEQVMQIARIVAGYSLGQADLLRRAMGKKKAEAMARQRSSFVEGAAKNGIDEKKANEIFDLMEKFAAYGFNKSHSAAYAQIAYYAAYLKVHFPCEFMAALLTSNVSDKDKLSDYLSLCREKGLVVLPPSANEAMENFSVHNGEILFGLAGIKGVASKAIQAIIEHRPYASFFDFCSRVAPTRTVLEALIKGGAFDYTGASRNALLQIAEPTLKVVRAQKKQIASAKTRSKSYNVPDIPAVVDDWDSKLRDEKEVLGTYLSGYPLDKLAFEMARMQCTPLAQLQAGKRVHLCVLVCKVNEKEDRKGKLMAVVSLEDRTGRAEALVFNSSYSPEVQAVLHSGKTLWITGKVEVGRRIIAHQVMLFKDVCEKKPITIRMSPRYMGTSTLQELAQILRTYPGNVPVKIELIFPELRYGETLKDIHIEISPKLHDALSRWGDRVPDVTEPLPEEWQDPESETFGWPVLKRAGLL